MSEIWKVVKTRKNHICSACNCEIRKGEYAYKQSVLYTSFQRYPTVYYYHYSSNFHINSVRTWSWNEFRKHICRFVTEKLEKEYPI